MSDSRPCTRCGQSVTVGGNSGPTSRCRDCRSTDPIPDGHPIGRDVQPHPDGERLGQEAVARGQQLACAIRDDGAYEVARITDPLSRTELVALAVALAAMVPLDRPAADLLAWVDGPALPEGQRFPELRWSEDALRMAHRAWNAGERDPWSSEGERVYQQQRHQRRKAEKAVDNGCVATGLRPVGTVESRGNKAAPAGNRGLTASPTRLDREEQGLMQPTISAPRDNTGEAC